jgi:PAS domain S-box-containing protein
MTVRRATQQRKIKHKAKAVRVLILDTDAHRALRLARALARVSGDGLSCLLAARLSAALDSLERGGCKATVVRLDAGTRQSTRPVTALRRRHPDLAIVALAPDGYGLQLERVLAAGADEVLAAPATNARAVSHALALASARRRAARPSAKAQRGRSAATAAAADADATLFKRNEMFRALAENSTDVIMRFDRSLRHLYVNDMVAAQTGIAAHDFIGRTHRELGFPEALCTLLEGALERVFDTGSVDRVQFQLPNGIWIDWLLMPERTRDGSVAHVVTVARDITEHKNTEAVLARTGRELEQRVAERTAALKAANEELRAEVAERCRADDRLRETEGTMRALLDASPSVAMLIDRNGSVLATNAHTAARFGRTMEQMLGRNVFDLFDPAVAERRRTRTDEVLRTGRPVRFEDESRGRLFSSTYFPVFDARANVVHVAIFAQDITEAQQAEALSRRLATAVEQAAEAIVITDTKGTIEYVNPAFERVTGYTSAEVIGGNPRILKSDQHDAEFYRRMWETLMRGDVWTGHFINKNKFGSLYEEEAVISPIRDAGGTIVNFVAVKRDVTQEAVLAAQLRESQKMEAIGQLAGGVAHDFNNLLQALVGTVELLRARGHDSEARARTILELETDIQRGAALARQLLLFTSRSVQKIERLDLNDVVRHAASLLRRLVRENILFEIELSDYALPINGDRGQLEQVLVNLAVNAVDAMLEGGRLIIRTGTRGYSEVYLEMRDSGVGVPEALRDRIFEPFFTTKQPGLGTGLGLFVVKEILSRHQGRVDVVSREGGGSTFTIVLPHAVAMGTGVHSEVAPARGAAWPGHGERVLLVEDEDGARESLTEILHMLGYEVTAAASGEEAGLLPVEPAVDILLTDLLLPGVHGHELAAGLLDRWPGLRIIYMSGYTADESLRQSVHAGNVHFLQKPFTMEELAQELRDVLANLTR